MKYIDIFAGAGGFSEGFIRAGYEAVAHVDMNIDAVETIRTRLAYYYLKKEKKLSKYYEYLSGRISKNSFYALVPPEILNTAIQYEMSQNNLNDLFIKIDNLKGSNSIDVVLGGPPCQAYSLAGRAKQRRIALVKKKGHADDDNRKYLYKLYCEFLKRYQPKLFVFENVMGLLTADNGKHWNDINIMLEGSGYKIQYKLLNSKIFGVPQERKRIIIIGWRKDINLNFPEFKQISPSWKLMDVLGDLPKIKAGESASKYSRKKPHPFVSKYLREKDDVLTHHYARPVNDRDQSIYTIAIKEMNNSRRLKYYDLPNNLKTHRNQKVFTDRFKVVPSNIPCCHTVLAHISKDGHYYIHYDENQTRSLTVREAARIQSFPDNYFFEGSRTSAYIQIGNAVPPLMAEAIANALKIQLKNI